MMNEHQFYQTLSKEGSLLKIGLCMKLEEGSARLEHMAASSRAEATRNLSLHALQIFL